MKPRYIVLVMPPSRPLMEGIARYARPDHPWAFEMAPLSQAVMESLVREPPDGVIAYLGDESGVQAAQRIPAPVVNISGAVAKSALPRVCTDSVAAGRLAADHLLERGFEHFGFVGYAQPAFSQERHRGFAQRLAVQGRSCEVFWTSVALSYETRQRSAQVDEQLNVWLERLPAPAAVFAANDSLAWWTSEVASLAGRHIPNDLAVLGMDKYRVQLLELAAVVQRGAALRAGRLRGRGVVGSVDAPSGDRTRACRLAPGADPHHYPSVHRCAGGGRPAAAPGRAVHSRTGFRSRAGCRRRPGCDGGSALPGTAVPPAATAQSAR